MICPRCDSTNVEPGEDLVYRIVYYKCFNCGNVMFKDTGLKILRFRLRKGKKRESISKVSNEK